MKVVVDESDELMRRCDGCGAQIEYGEEARMRYTGDEFDGLPVVTFLHVSCAGRQGGGDR